MLCKYPNQRISAMEALQHEFFSDFEHIEEAIQINLEELLKMRNVGKNKDNKVPDSFV